MILFKFCLLSFLSVLAESTNVGIIDGTDADIKDFPWMVSVYEGNDVTCGGSLISPNWVLTAGHCAIYSNISRIRAGSSNLKDDNGTFINVVEVIIHPNFIMNNHGGPFNDLTLLRLDSLANGTNIAPIRLPEPNTPIPENHSITITGWGDTTGRNKYPDDLKVVTINIPLIQECKSTYKEYDYIVDEKGEFCAGTFGEYRGTCHGDSGGPAEINGTIYGMVSWGYSGCSTSGFPVVLVNIPKYSQWIRDVTGINP